MTTAEYAIQDAAVNGSDLLGLQGIAGEYGREVRSPASDGQLHQTLHHVRRYAPSARFTSRHLDSVLDILADSTDTPVVALDGSSGLVMVAAQQESDAPGYDAGATAETITALRGVLFATGLSWGIDAGTTLELAALLRSADGDTASITRGTAALGTPPVPTEAWDLASIVISTDAAAGVDGIQSVEQTFDAKFRQRWNGSKPWPVLVHGAGGAAGPIEHGLTFTTTDRSFERTLGIAGTTGRTVTVTYKRYVQGGALGADEVTFVYNNCLVTPGNAHQAAMGQPDQLPIIVRPRWDGTTKPVTWSTPA